MVQNLGKAEASALIERAKQVSLLHDFVVSLSPASFFKISTQDLCALSNHKPPETKLHGWVLTRCGGQVCWESAVVVGVGGSMSVLFYAHAHLRLRQISDRTYHTWTLDSHSISAQNTLILQTFGVSFWLVLSTFVIQVLSGASMKFDSLRKKNLEYFESMKIYQGKV